MQCCPQMRHIFSAVMTITVLGAVLGFMALNGSTGGPEQARAEEPVSAAAKGDWPMFGGSLDRNMVNLTEKNVPVKWDARKKLNIKWVERLGSRAYGGPVIADGKLFVGTNNAQPRDPKVTGDRGNILCFEAATGKFLWQAIHDKLPAGRVNDWPLEGICSTPFIEGNRFYYISNRCEVVCGDTEGFLDGKNDGAQDEQYKGEKHADFIWRYDMMKHLGVFPHNLATCSPLVVGDIVFVVTSNGVDEEHLLIPKPKAPSFIALNKKTGELLWTDNTPTAALLEPGAKLKPLADQGKVVMHGQWSNPTYVEVDGKGQVIFPGGDGWLYALEPKTGKLIWKFDCNPKDSFYVLGPKGTRNDFIATPVAHKGKLYIGVGQDPEHLDGVGHFWCIDLAKATKVGGDVSAVNDNYDASAAVNKNSALVWHFGGVIKGAPGRAFRFGRTMSTAAIVDGLVYVSDWYGVFHCLDAETGKEYWQHDLNGTVWSSPFYVDGKIYMGNDKRRVIVFEHGKKKKVLATNRMDGRVRATPTVVNGILYVMTENKLYAIAE